MRSATSRARHWLTAGVVGLLVVLGALGPLASPALAVRSTGATRVTPAPAAAGAYAQYNVGAFTVGNNQTVTRMRVTFPAQCNVSAAQPVDPGDTLIISGQTVTIVFGTPKLQNTNFTGRIGNVRNPSLSGSYTINGTVVFTLSSGATENHNLKKNNFTILASPYLVLTITTPADPQDVDFGAVDPGVTLTSDVEVEVDSSRPYTITRTIGGQSAQLGLTIVGLVPGAKLAGYALYTDVFSISPPWSTDPGAYSATVAYTVVHN